MLINFEDYCDKICDLIKERNYNIVLKMHLIDCVH